ncbi:hypothetical protein AB0D04_23355 [Streptomyces sp. NPDC048483]|uniref:hypothetical protein n=1 Tax=Streptomyces sp. NPDC048483 TaxID=3154927 RepID=UPI0034156E45
MDAALELRVPLAEAGDEHRVFDEAHHLEPPVLLVHREGGAAVQPLVAQHFVQGVPDPFRLLRVGRLGDGHLEAHAD